jgi:hypothetical protein|eukprot:5053344-Prymnesium_polylepis.1
MTRTFAQHVNELDEMKGEDIYKGYIDDPRNTDNAWVESLVFHFRLPEDLSCLLPLRQYEGQQLGAPPDSLM